MPYRFLSLAIAALLTIVAGWPSINLAQGDLPASARQAREWTSSDGATISAAILHFKGNTVRMRRQPGGQILDIPIGLFSEANQIELIRLRLLSDYTAESIDSGNAVDLFPADLDSKQRREQTYPYLRIGRHSYSFHLHLGGNIGQLPAFSSLRFTFDLTENLETPLPDNQVFPVDSDVGYDLQIPDPIDRRLYDQLITDKSLYLSVGANSKFQTLELSNEEIERLRELGELLKLFFKLSPKSAEWRLAILDPHQFGLSDQGAAPLPIESSYQQSWENVLGQSIDAEVRHFERDRVAFKLVDGSPSKTALRNLTLESREQAMTQRLADCYYTWTSSDTGYSYYAPKDFSRSEQDMLSRIVYGRKPAGTGIWFYVPTANPYFSQSDRLRIWPDRRREPIEIPFGGGCTVFVHTIKGVTWNQHVYSIKRMRGDHRAVIRNCRTLRLELRKGDQSIWIQPTTREVLEIQRLLFLQLENSQLTGLRKQAASAAE